MSSSSEIKLISRSSWVCSGWRSARRASSRRRGRGQDGRLDLREAALGQEIADELGDAGAEDDVPVDRLAAEVQVAVLEAQQLVDVRLLDDIEGRRLGLVEDGGGVGPGAG